MFRYLPLMLKNSPRNRQQSAQEVLTLVGRLNREFGKTIVMVTHDPHATRAASKIRHLEKGELLPEGQVPADYSAA